MYKMTVKNVFFISMFNFTVGFHVIASREYLMAYGTLMLLWTMYVGVMPAIRHRFMATHAAIQRWKSSRQLNEQRWIVNVMIAACWRWIATLPWRFVTSVREKIVNYAAVIAAVRHDAHQITAGMMVARCHQRMQNQTTSITCNNTGTFFCFFFVCFWGRHDHDHHTNFLKFFVYDFVKFWINLEIFQFVFIFWGGRIFIILKNYYFKNDEN